jgi:LPXTG-motif cell wall-anchored protein
VGAIADGVSIALLRGVSGGIILNLAHAEATVKGAPAVVTAPVVVPQLPRTGGSPWIPLVGVTLLGLAFVTHRTARRVHR